MKKEGMLVLGGVVSRFLFFSLGCLSAELLEYSLGVNGLTYQTGQMACFVFLSIAFLGMAFRGR
ncbi:hypothetical protein QBC39DRAFT_351128 [Podospora conica]|nr:hypothetical protein QBC39DRAFT_351128 [Schizothecium conicum]